MIILFYFLNIFIVVQVQFSAFSSHHSLPPRLSPPPFLVSTPPARYCPCVLYHCSCKPFTLFPYNNPLLFYLITVSLFSISVSLVIFCFLVCFVDQFPFLGEIIWHLTFTTWIISLSIMLSSCIHVVTKGRSSFFLSAAQNSIV